LEKEAADEAHIFQWLSHACEHVCQKEVPESDQPKRRYYYIPKGLQKGVSTLPVEKPKRLDANAYEENKDGEGECCDSFLENYILHLNEKSLTHKAKGPDCE
jgi:hypothetical protein